MIINFKKSKQRKAAALATLLAAILIPSACGTTAENATVTSESLTETEKTATASEAPTSEATVSIDIPEVEKEDLSKYFEDLALTDAYKNIGKNNPLITQRFGADPYAISYNGRVYVYMTGDVVEYDEQGNAKSNSYGQIKTLNVISSEDMVNWTDHGWINVGGAFGVTEWGGNSWAPAVAYKNIDGQDKFFIYFANGGNGIGVLESDSPTGPFNDPIGKALISRSTPNCSNVTWLFDPAVFVDDDGRAYIYFGGGVPEGQQAAPGTARAAELGADMISLASQPIAIDVPYLFEDAGINKVNGKYLYSYCTNWQVDNEGKKLGLDNASIVYMSSDNPLGPFTLENLIVKNPGVYFGGWGNNHHCIFEHLGEYYIAYHSFVLDNRMKINNGYRSTHIDKVTVSEDGLFEPMKYTENGVNALGTLDPYQLTQAETIGAMAGISVNFVGKRALYAEGDVVVSDIDTGDWILIYGADFNKSGKDGATKFTANISFDKNAEERTFVNTLEADGADTVSEEAGAEEEDFGIIEIRAGGIDGEAVGYLKIEAGEGDYKEITVDLNTVITGVNDIAFVFYGSGGYTFDYWYFS